MAQVIEAKSPSMSNRARNLRARSVYCHRLVPKAHPDKDSDTRSAKVTCIKTPSRYLRWRQIKPKRIQGGTLGYSFQVVLERQRENNSEIRSAQTQNLKTALRLCQLRQSILKQPRECSAEAKSLKTTPMDAYLSQRMPKRVHTHTDASILSFFTLTSFYQGIVNKQITHPKERNNNISQTSKMLTMHCSPISKIQIQNATGKYKFIGYLNIQTETRQQSASKHG